MSLGHLLTGSLDRTDIDITRPYKYLVYADSPYYRVIDGRSLKQIYKSILASEAIQYAIDRLTPGRTFREIICLAGDITIDQTIDLADYLKLIILDKITLGDGVNAPMFKGDQKSEIEIYGGIWDGNKANQTAEESFIKFDGVEKIFLHDIIFKNSLGCGVSVADTLATNRYLTFKNLWGFEVKNTVEIWGTVGNKTYQVDVKNCYGYNNAMTVVAFNSVWQFLVEGCLGQSNGHEALKFEGDCGEGAIVSNICLQNSLAGIYTGGLNRSVVAHNIVKENQTDGISVAGAVLVNFCHNIVQKNTGSGFVFGYTYPDDVRYCRVEGNIIGGEIPAFETYENTEYGIKFSANCVDLVVKNNRIIKGGTSGNIFNESTSIVFSGNEGYRTENYGYSSFDSDGTVTAFTVSHGLVDTPIGVQISPYSTEASGDFYIQRDSINFIVNYITAPPAGTVKFGWEAYL
jgi:hypothetical protein